MRINMGVFDKAKRKVKELDRLQKLASDLEKLGPIPTVPDKMYPYAIKYFNIIVKFQDAGPIIADDFKKSSKEISNVLAHIKNSGRDQYGWVRAKPGEMVTMDNLYLGDVHGLWTNPASMFRASKDPDVQQIIYNQLYTFIKSHLMPLQKDIAKITKTDSVNVMQKAVAGRLVSRKSNSY